MTDALILAATITVTVPVIVLIGVRSGWLQTISQRVSPPAPWSGDPTVTDQPTDGQYS